jgi:hypothetical protein
VALDLRPGERRQLRHLFIVLGGRWRIDQKLPSAGTLQGPAAASVRRLGFECRDPQPTGIRAC